MATPEPQFAQYAGLVQFPLSTAELRSTTACPACFTPLASTTCSNCHLDLTHPAAVELAAVSSTAADALERRAELIGKIRYETSRGVASAAVAPVTATVAQPAPVIAPPAPPLATPVADAPPRRHLGVQVILLIVGVSLLSIGAIFFLIFAFVNFGLIWQTVIVVAVTIALIVGAGILRRRKLPVTAEAIAALALVFVYLDVFGLRDNNLLGAQSADGLVYWGLALVLSAVAFAFWHRASGLRIPNLVAFASAGPGLALLAGGITGSVDDSLRTYFALIVLALAGFVHLLADKVAERWLPLALATIGLVGAGLTSIFIDESHDWAPTMGIAIVAVIAFALAGSVVHHGQPLRMGYVLSGVAGLASAAAVAGAGTRVSGAGFMLLAAPIAAVVIALALEYGARRVAPIHPHFHRAAVVATIGAAAAAAILTLVPLARVLGSSARVIVSPSSDPDPNTYLAVISLVVIVILLAIAWLAGGVIGRRGTALAWAAAVVLVLAPALFGMPVPTAIAWLVLAALGVAALVARPSWITGIRAPLAAATAAAALFGYLAAQGSDVIRWIASMVVIVLLVVARYATSRIAVRAALLGIAALVAFVAAGTYGAYLNGQLTFGNDATLEGFHFVAATAIVTLLASMIPALSFIESRVLFWIALAVAVMAGAFSWLAGGSFRELVVSDAAASIALPVALIVVLAFIAYLLRGRAPERLAATITVLVAIAWLVDSIARAANLDQTVPAMVLVVTYSAIHVAALLIARPPLTRLIGWIALALAAITALVGIVSGTIDPLEWATVVIAAALLVTGIVRIRQMPAASSWSTLSAGLLVLLVPSLFATFVDQPIWRLVGLGVACIAAILVGALGKLQAPLVIGALVVLAHGIRTFAPQIVAVYQLTEWWVWAVIGGAIILFVALTLERRVRNLRSIGTRLSALR